MSSINIWIKTKRMPDDSTSVSSLTTAFALDGSSSFYSSNDCSVDVTFDLTLLKESEDTNTNTEDATDDGSVSVHVQDRPSRNSSRDWRWESDPNLPLQRDLGKNVDMPLIPLRRWSSSKSSRSVTGTSTSKKQNQQRRKSRKMSSPLSSLLQRPRMPRRKLSDSSAAEKQEQGVAPALFTERLRRFPMEVPSRPTHNSNNKLSAARRIRRLTRPCRLPTRRSSSGNERSDSQRS